MARESAMGEAVALPDGIKVICRHCGSVDRTNWKTECLWPRGEDGPCIIEEQSVSRETNDCVDTAMIIGSIGLALTVGAIMFKFIGAAGQ